MIPALGTLVLTLLLLPLVRLAARRPGVWVYSYASCFAVWELNLLLTILTSMPEAAEFFWVCMALVPLPSVLPLLLFRRMKAGRRISCSLLLYLGCAGFLLYQFLVMQVLFSTPSTQELPWWAGLWVK